MREIIEENAKQGYKEYLQALRKNRRKERALSILIGLFIVSVTCLLMFLSIKMTEDAQKNCIEAGHSKAYCEAKL